MKTQTLNMFAETNEDLPLISGMTFTQPFAVETPQYDDDGLNGYYLGCSIYIVPVSQWTVGPAPIRYRITVEKGLHTRTEYEDGLPDAHAKAEYLARYFDRLNN